MSQDQNRLVDPDPWGIIVGIAAIISSTVSTTNIIRTVVRESSASAYRDIRYNLQQASDTVRYIEADIEVLSSILASADISSERRFRPGATAFLSNDQFRRYEKTTDLLLRRLREIVRISNKLDRLLPRLNNRNLENRARNIVEIQDRLERIINDQSRSVGEVLSDLQTALSALRRLMDEIGA